MKRLAVEQLANEVMASGRRMAWVRRFGWVVLLGELSALCGCVSWLAGEPEHWRDYAVSLAFVLGFYHALPRLIAGFFFRPKVRVGRCGNRWEIGQYSEARLRELVEEVERAVPVRLRRITVGVADVREIQAWTYLSVLWPTWAAHKPIRLTSGSLHYLQPDEIRAVLLHEIGHHDSANRVHVPGGWPLTDIVLHAVVFCAAVACYLQSLTVLLFMLSRGLLAIVVMTLFQKTPRYIEHRCDLFAAAHSGPAPLINALLKLGEEEELTEVVLVWAARDFLDAPDIDVDDLAIAFSEVRPYGRIFHENLFRHAGEIVKHVESTWSPKHKPAKRKRPRNADLAEFVRKRRSRQQPRIRWRRFDRDGDGTLEMEEIVQLCAVLEQQPNHVLVTSESEHEPTSHPPFRDRVLLIHHFATSQS